MGTDYTTLALDRRIKNANLGNISGGGTILRPPLISKDALTERTFRIWSAGDYDRIAAGFRHEAAAFVARLGLTPEMEVLDAACGSGNLTIPAARTGAQVTGLDLVPHLLDAAAIRAARELLTVKLDEGTVEELPYSDGEFDVVMSMFGVMFASRPDRVVSELARVTKPGGKVALANWTAYGFVGQMLWKHVAYLPPPAGATSPLLWGDESVIRERFVESDWDVTTNLRTLTFRYPHTPADTARLFRTYYGPTVRAFEALDNDLREYLADDLVKHWTLHQRAGASGTEVDAEYLEVIATRR